MTSDTARTARAGLIYGLGAYVVWGLMPAYFKLLANVLPSEAVAHRIVWSVLFLTIVATVWRKWPEIIATVRAPGVAPRLALTSTLIAVNWLTYVWAVINGHVLEASIGYYLNPLVNVLLGTAVLKERLSR